MFLEACSVLTIKHQDKSAGIVFEYFHAGFEVFFKDFVEPPASKRMWSSYFLVTKGCKTFSWY